MGSTGRS